MIKQDSIKDIVQHEGIGLNEEIEQDDRIGQHEGIGQDDGIGQHVEFGLNEGLGQIKYQVNILLDGLGQHEGLGQQEEIEQRFEELGQHEGPENMKDYYTMLGQYVGLTRTVLTHSLKIVISKYILFKYKLLFV